MIGGAAVPDASSACSRSASGAITRNTAGGIATFAGIFFVIPPLLNILPDELEQHDLRVPAEQRRRRHLAAHPRPARPRPLAAASRCSAPTPRSQSPSPPCCSFAATPSPGTVDQADGQRDDEAAAALGRTAVTSPEARPRKPPREREPETGARAFAVARGKPRLPGSKMLSCSCVGDPGTVVLDHVDDLRARPVTLTRAHDVPYRHAFSTTGCSTRSARSPSSPSRSGAAGASASTSTRRPSRGGTPRRPPPLRPRTRPPCRARRPPRAALPHERLDDPRQLLRVAEHELEGLPVLLGRASRRSASSTSAITRARACAARGELGREPPFVPQAGRDAVEHAVERAGEQRQLVVRLAAVEAPVEVELAPGCRLLGHPSDRAKCGFEQPPGQDPSA